MVVLGTVLFGVAATAATAIITTLLVTLLTQIRLWPPGDDSRRAALHWGLVAVFDLCLVGVAISTWNSWILPRPSSVLLGPLLSGGGAAIFVASSLAMSAAETAGQTATELNTDGLYARTRNPQYVGMMIGLAGFALLANSVVVTTLCLLRGCWLVLLPFAEEPWLRERFGDEYDAYCNRVPRFVSRRTLHRP